MSVTANANKQANGITEWLIGTPTIEYQDGYW